MNAPDPSATFLSEAQELLEQLEGALLDLERLPGERSLVDTAFRALHTIKGSGSMFGFDTLAAFTHHVESAFDQVRKGSLSVTPALVGVALKAADHMRTLLERPNEVDPTVGDAILDDLGRLTGAESDAAQAPVSALSDHGEGVATYRIRFRLPANALLMGNNPILLLEELRSLGDCTVVALTDRVPALEEIDPESCYLAWDVILTTEQPRSAIEAVFIFVIDDMELSIERVQAHMPKLGEVLVERGEVSPSAVDSALRRQEPLGALLVQAGEVSEDRVKSALAEQNHLRNVGGAAQVAAGKATETMRVAADRLDSLMDGVGELVIAQARLKQLAGASDNLQIKSVAEEIERLASSLRDIIMGIRMVPIGSLFGRFRRLVRDLSQDLGKDIVLETSGEETELDKTVIDRLADPIVHLIRNAADHGLEDAAVRLADGKPAEGRVQLSATHAGSQVLITIRDDGKGLDRARIRAKAEAEGLIEPGAKLSDGELLQLIFLPGLSTAKEVTNLSGRGVGMDVVKRTIDALRGTIEIASTPGKGTEITLRLPLTLAIIDGLLVRVGEGRYAIPLAAVEECVELSAGEDGRSKGRSILNVRGELVPFLRLRELFATGTEPDPYQKVVIVSSGDSRVGLVVDQVIGDHQTVIKSLSKLHADVENFSGATILGDGSVALILDVARLISFGQNRDDEGKTV